MRRGIAGISAAGTAIGSRARIVRSAAYPGAMRPLLVLLEAAYAASEVKSARASARRELLAGPPSARGPAVEVLPRHRSVEPEERVLGFHREVAAARDADAGIFSRRQA